MNTIPKGTHLSRHLKNLNQAGHKQIRGTRKTVFLLLVGCLSLGRAALLAADDAAADFSTSSNPNGVWKYGYKIGSTFTSMPSSATKVHSNPDVWFYQGALGVGPYYEPTIGKNVGTNNFVIGGTTVYPPGGFALHPGPNAGQRAALRWTAPSAGTYRVIASFKGGDASTSTDAQIEKSGTEIWSEIVSGNATPQVYTATLSVTTNEVIDFMVERNGNYVYDTTLTSVFISPTSECYDAGADFSTNNNPTGVWTYGVEDLQGNFSTIPGDAERVNENPDVWFWQGGSGVILEPTVGKNLGTTDWYPFDSTTTYRPGDLGLHPGPDGERAVIRWTAPTNGTYQVFASFSKGDPSTTTDVKIMKSGSPATQLHSGNTPQVYNQSLTVTTGQTLEFSVGFGGDDYFNDTTITVISICRDP